MEDEETMLRAGKRRFRLAFLSALAAAAAGPSAMTMAQPQYAPQGPVRVDFGPAEEAAHRALAAQIRAIAEGFSGDIGIAVEDVQSGWKTADHGGHHFPQPRHNQ